MRFGCGEATSDLAGIVDSRGALCLPVELSRLTQPLAQQAPWDDEVLLAGIHSSFASSDRTYGSRRVWHDVLAERSECRTASH